MSKKINQKEKSKPGAKTKLDDRLMEKAFEEAKKGCTRSQIAINIGICQETFYTYMRNPIFLDIIKKGEELAISHIENQLYKRASGYTVKEKKEIIGGTNARVEITDKEVAPDVTAQIFLLKNKKPLEYKDRHDIEHSGKIGIEAQLELLTDEQLKKELDRLRNATAQ